MVQISLKSFIPSYSNLSTLLLACQAIFGTGNLQIKKNINFAIHGTLYSCIIFVFCKNIFIKNFEKFTFAEEP